MKNQLDRFTDNRAQSVTCFAVLKKIGAGLALLVALSAVVLAGSTPGHTSGKIPVTGKSDWSIVPASITPPFLFSGTDGDFYVRHLPLVGKLSLAGGNVSIEAKISADFNAELDPTFSGVLWAPVTITATINGAKTILFDGNATGTTVGLVSAGTITLEGHGPFEGARLELGFTEIGPGNTDTYNLTGVLLQGPAH